MTIYTHTKLCVLFYLFMRHNRRSVISLMVILGITLLFIAFVNYWRFGSFTEFGYGYFQSLSAHGGWIGLFDLLVSPEIVVT
jgi:hypothetical protein